MSDSLSTSCNMSWQRYGNAGAISSLHYPIKRAFHCVKMLARLAVKCTSRCRQCRSMCAGDCVIMP